VLLPEPGPPPSLLRSPPVSRPLLVLTPRPRTSHPLTSPGTGAPIGTAPPQPPARAEGAGVAELTRRAENARPDPVASSLPPPGQARCRGVCPAPSQAIRQCCNHWVEDSVSCRGPGGANVPPAHQPHGQQHLLLETENRGELRQREAQLTYFLGDLGTLFLYASVVASVKWR
jgi:hypothetical protein